LSAALPGISASLVTALHVDISLASLTDNEVTVNFTVFNPLDTQIQITNIQGTGTLQGTTWAQFSFQFDDFVIPAGSSVDSGPVPNVLLTQGVIASTAIIPFGVLNVAVAQTVIIGDGGYTIPWLQYQQDNVPTTYALDILGLLELPVGGDSSALKKTVESISSSLLDPTPTSSMSKVASSSAPITATVQSTVTPKPSIAAQDQNPAESPAAPALPTVVAAPVVA